ncbi:MULTISPECIES: hypothetical protein [unclassified Streptomyces]|uniref:hypothetical protein n=1 Tax=unclassified Streptomyces TaxID=2593676 RepID=UPI0036F14CF9
MAVSPAAARSRARWASSAVVLVILSPFLVWLLAAVSPVPHGAAVICAFVAGPLGFLLLPELCQETRLITCSMSRVTARTLTGERTVDLRRIRSVRLYVGFGYGRVHHTLVVRDEEGVRLGLTTVRSRHALKRALQGVTVGNAGGPRVGVAARALLGLAPRRHLTVHTVIGFLLLVVVITSYVVAVLRIAGG